MSGGFLIIQSPLMTFGQGANNSEGGYSVEKNLAKYKVVCEKIKLPFIFVTWVPASRAEIEVLEQIKLLELDYLLLEYPDFVDLDHRRKHHFAILQGLKYIELNHPNVDVVCKVRADQLIDLSNVKNLIGYSRASDFFYVSEFMSPAFFCGDFFYCAKLCILKRFCENMIAPLRVHPSIGVDIGLSLFAAFQHLKICEEGRFSKFRALFESFGIGRPIVWNRFNREYLRSLDRDTWRAIEWRGKWMHQILDDKFVIFYSNPTELGMSTNLISMTNSLVAAKRLLVKIIKVVLCSR